MAASQELNSPPGQLPERSATGSASGPHLPWPLASHGHHAHSQLRSKCISSATVPAACPDRPAAAGCRRRGVPHRILPCAACACAGGALVRTPQSRHARSHIAQHLHNDDSKVQQTSKSTSGCCKMTAQSCPQRSQWKPQRQRARQIWLRPVRMPNVSARTLSTVGANASKAAPACVITSPPRGSTTWLHTCNRGGGRQQPVSLPTRRGGGHTRVDARQQVLHACSNEVAVSRALQRGCCTAACRR